MKRKKGYLIRNALLMAASLAFLAGCGGKGDGSSAELPQRTGVEDLGIYDRQLKNWNILDEQGERTSTYEGGVIPDSCPYRTLQRTRRKSVSGGITGK